MRSIRWRIALPIVLLILGSLLVLTAYLAPTVRQAQMDGLRTHLLADARLLAGELQRYPDRAALAGQLQGLVLDWGDRLGARVSVVGVEGDVLADSQREAASLGDHLRRPEVRDALSFGSGTSIRESATLGYALLYAAVPYRLGDAIDGVVRVAVPFREIDDEADRLTRAMVVAALLTSAGAALVAVTVAGRLVRPIRQLAQAAERMGQGDLSARAATLRDDEIGRLGRAFNDMAVQLQSRLALYADESARLSAVLEHMADGVVMTNSSGEVRLINPAACRMLGTTRDEATGRTYMQIVRHHEISDLWELSRDTGSEQEEAIDLRGRGLYLRVIVTPLPAEDGLGSMVILQDLTALRRADRMRRDFVGNASHELRTPIASLKALVETLRDGAIDDPPAAQRFLSRMEGEVDSLAQMAQELLELSRIESEQAQLAKEATPVADLVIPPVEHLRPQAERGGVALTVELPEGLPEVNVDSERVRQVVTNLVHNAVKFTGPGGSVVVSAEQVGDQMVISVHDTGIGIPVEDVPRIFERFYKTDRARAGGGTGLGLAIAQHVVKAHGGRIWAESIEGRGSTFRFTLPLAPEA